MGRFSVLGFVVFMAVVIGSAPAFADESKGAEKSGCVELCCSQRHADCAETAMNEVRACAVSADAHCRQWCSQEQFGAAPEEMMKCYESCYKPRLKICGGMAKDHEGQCCSDSEKYCRTWCGASAQQ